MKHYGVVKTKAKEFANERNKEVFIAKANKITDYVIIFAKEQLTPNYSIIETVRPQNQ